MEEEEAILDGNDKAFWYVLVWLQEETDVKHSKILLSVLYKEFNEEEQNDLSWF
jgi:hypothetical protein